jgi:hypothetical protein
MPFVRIGCNQRFDRKKASKENKPGMARSLGSRKVKLRVRKSSHDSAVLHVQLPQSVGQVAHQRALQRARDVQNESIGKALSDDL